MSGEMSYVWAAFVLTWISMGGYALMLMRRVRRAEAELAREEEK